MPGQGPSSQAACVCARRCSLAARADLGSYLAEAATAIFRPAPNNNVPWGGTGGGFTGTPRCRCSLLHWQLVTEHCCCRHHHAP